MAKFLKQYEILYKKSNVDLNTAKVILQSVEDGNIELDLNVVFFSFTTIYRKIN